LTTVTGGTIAPRGFLVSMTGGASKASRSEVCSGASLFASTLDAAYSVVNNASSSVTRSA
jgi:hypothetical protein